MFGYIVPTIKPDDLLSSLLYMNVMECRTLFNFWEPQIETSNDRDTQPYGSQMIANSSILGFSEKPNCSLSPIYLQTRLTLINFQSGLIIDRGLPVSVI